MVSRKRRALRSVFLGGKTNCCASARRHTTHPVNQGPPSHHHHKQTLPTCMQNIGVSSAAAGCAAKPRLRRRRCAAAAAAAGAAAARDSPAARAAAAATMPLLLDEAPLRVPVVRARVASCLRSLAPEEERMMVMVCAVQRGGDEWSLEVSVFDRCSRDSTLVRSAPRRTRDLLQEQARYGCKCDASRGGRLYAASSEQEGARSRAG